MDAITIHSMTSGDYSGSGLGLLKPLDMTVRWVLNGMYQLDATVALNEPMAAALQLGAVIVAPVPAQETPSLRIGGTAGSTQSREIWRVKTNGSNLHLRSGPGTKYKILSKYRNGTELVLLEKTNGSWYRMAAPDGASGYMAVQWLKYLRTETETISGSEADEVIAPKPVRRQPFRIHRIEPGLLTVTVHARQLFYDLSDNLVLPHTYENVTRQGALSAILSRCLNADHGFTARCEGAQTATLELTEPVSPVEALLGDGGLIDRLGGEVMADWLDVYVVDRLGSDRGVEVRYGKNLTAVGGALDADDMATRIVPIGESDKGEDLYLPEVYLEAAGAQPWAHPRYGVLRVEGAQVRKSMTAAQAYEKMRAAARELLDSGAAKANASITVEFVEDSKLMSASDMAKLQKLFPGDDVAVSIAPMGITAKLRLVEYVFDCLLLRYRSATLGSAGRDIATSGIDPRQLPSGGISGAKLANASVQAKQLADGSVKSAKIGAAAIEIAHIQQATIDTLKSNSLEAVKADIREIVAGKIDADALTAGAVTAEKLAAGSVTAEKLSAGAVEADKIAADSVKAEKIEAGAVDTAKLAAGAVTAEKIASGTITADRLKAKTITAESGIIDDSAIGTAQIADGSITSAKIVELNADLIKAGTLSAERLLLVGEDGVIYKINAASSGLSLTELQKDQYKNYINGTVIVAKSITAAQIAAQSITGNEILAGSITAKEIDVSDLFADEATVNALNAMDIRGNKYLQLYVTDKVDGISVGGRNLYTGTQNFDGDTWKGKSLWTEDGSYKGCLVYKRAGLWNGLGQMIALEANTQYTLSAWLKQTDGGTVRYYDTKANGASSSDKGGSAVEVGTSWSRRHVTFTVSTADTYCPRFEQNGDGHSLWVAGLKLEKGNKPTDWSPAPEDVSSAIEANTAEITLAKNSITSLVSKVDGISIGGRNLLRNTNQGATNWGWSMQTGGKTVEEYLDGGVRACKMTRDAVEQTGWSVISYDMGANEYALLEPNTEYTLSFDYKPSVTTANGAAFSIRRGDGSNAATNDGGYWKEIPANEWTHVSGTFTTAANLPDFLLNSTEIYITRLPTTANSVHIFKNLKLEKGNKSTDWSPAPEDIEARVTTAESKIDQKADSITLSVLETKVDNISVGGRNYILNSDEYDPITGNGGAAQDCYIFKIADAFWSNDERIHSNIVFSFDWEWNTGLPGAMNGLIAFRASPYYNASFQFPAGQKTGHVSLSIDIPTLDYTATHLFIRLVNVSASYSLTIRNAKLEVGNKETDWSPAPEDPAGSLSVSSDYSKVDINTERVRIVSKQMEVAVPSDDGEDDVLRVDADGVHAEVVEADMVVSDSVVCTQGKADYAPANPGELAAILEGLAGKHLTDDVSINCSSITSGSYTIRNVSGTGRVVLWGASTTVFNGLYIENCGDTIVSLYQIGLSNAEDALTVVRSYGVIVSTCPINARVGVRIGTSISTPGQVTMDSCTGDCTYVASVNYRSVLRCIGSSKPAGELYLTNGSEVYNATPDPTFAAKASPSIPTTQTVTVSLSPTSTYTSGYGSKLYQGRYSASQSLRRGVMLFALPADLASADSIDSATLTLRRIGDVGQGGGVVVQVRCFDQTGTLYASKTAYGGQTVSIDVTAAVRAMKANSYTGLMLYNPDTATVGGKSYTASYSRFAGKGESGAPTLKISYRK